jgi:hypothetical protein
MTTTDISLTSENIKEFFDNFIKPFAPYQEEKVYNSLINNLEEYFYQHAYDVVPTELKQIFESTDFESETLYNKFLLAVGVSENIINNITFDNKIIFLRSLSDFMRYKGTVTFFQKVGEVFGDKVNIYELYIDKVGDNWVFKPVSVYIQENIDEYLDNIAYNVIFNAVPSLILSEDQLNELYSEEKLILPIKSNIVLLNNTTIQYSSLINNLIVTFFLYTYRNEYINIYFSNDVVKPIILKNIYFLWYYLTTRYYGIKWNAFNADTVIRLIYNDQFPSFIGDRLGQIENLQNIIDTYNNIDIEYTATRHYDNSRETQLNLYNDILTAFRYNNAEFDETTINDMYTELSILNSDTLTYINNRISDSSLTEREELNLILQELYLSLQLYTVEHYDDGYFFSYSSYFLNSLSQILIKPEDTVTYKILHDLKPYHVEFYNSALSILHVSDNFNKVCIDDETDLSFQLDISKASAVTVGETIQYDFEKSLVSDVICRDSYVINDVVDVAPSYFKYSTEHPEWLRDNIEYFSDSRMKYYFIL